MTSSLLLYLAVRPWDTGAASILVELPLLVLSSSGLCTHARTEVGFLSHLLVPCVYSHRKNHRSAHGVYPLSLDEEHLLLITGALGYTWSDIGLILVYIWSDEIWRRPSFSSLQSFWRVSSILSSNLCVCSVKSISAAEIWASVGAWTVPSYTWSLLVIPPTYHQISENWNKTP